ncbi:MAG: hypothetical protein JST26_09615 [Bacteroidetes bacterium]|nr:hypothetical protein [Bacteroidota bacterium]
MEDFTSQPTNLENAQNDEKFVSKPKDPYIILEIRLRKKALAFNLSGGFVAIIAIAILLLFVTKTMKAQSIVPSKSSTPQDNEVINVLRRYLISAPNNKMFLRVFDTGDTGLTGGFKELTFSYASTPNSIPFRANKLLGLLNAVNTAATLPEQTERTPPLDNVVYFQLKKLIEIDQKLHDDLLVQVKKKDDKISGPSYASKLLMILLALVFLALARYFLQTAKYYNARADALSLLKDKELTVEEALAITAPPPVDFRLSKKIQNEMLELFKIKAEAQKPVCCCPCKNCRPCC